MTTTTSNLPANSSTATPTPSSTIDRRIADKVLATLAKKSFCTLASCSPAGRPHVAGVVYAFAEGELWIHALRSSRKVRNAGVKPRVANHRLRSC